MMRRAKDVARQGALRDVVAMLGICALLIALSLCFAVRHDLPAGELPDVHPVSGDGVLFTEDGPLINVNTADQNLLSTLPGIGPALAERIIAEREENGPFASVEDLTRVKGIGAGKLAAIQRKIGTQ